MLKFVITSKVIDGRRRHIVNTDSGPVMFDTIREALEFCYSKAPHGGK